MSKRQSDKTRERSGSRTNKKSPQWDLYDDLIHDDNEIEKSKNEISREMLTAEIHNLKEENSKIKERLSNLMVTAQDRIIHGPLSSNSGPCIHFYDSRL